MVYIFNRFTVYGAMLLILVMLVILFGCEAQNPICSDNFCVIGEVFPRSELEENQEFSEVNVNDSKILAVLIGTPQPTTELDTEPPTQLNTNITFADIVDDVAVNGVNSSYIGQTVTITAAVQFNYAGPNRVTTPFVLLITHNDKVSFFVDDNDDVNDLADLGSHTTYTFKVMIRSISEDTIAPGHMDVFSTTLEPPTQAGVQIEDITLADIVDDVAAGGRRFVGKTVRLKAAVSLDNAAFNNEGFMLLSTNNPNVTFYVGDITNPEKLNTYKTLLSYTFTLYIQDIVESDEDPGHFNIISGIADD